MEYYYLGLNIFSILCPLVLSFDKNVRYITKWKYSVISIIASFLIFLPWDLHFHKKGVWWFNEKYTLGIDVFGLPLEENLFFIAIPFACIFVLECVKHYLPNWVKFVDNKINWLWLLLFNVVTITLLIIYWDKLYSYTVFGLSLILINCCAIFARKFIPLCLISLGFIFIPFFLINGALTGGFTEEPVVIYSNDFISGIRVWTIPIEDFYYNTLMMISLFYFYFFYQIRILKKEII